MSEAQSSPDTVPATAVATRRRGRGGLVFMVLVLALGAAAAGYVYIELQRARSAAADGEDWRREVQSIDARLAALDRQLTQLDGGRRSLDERIAEVANNQRVIRQELLGMGERAATIEDAVARLSDQRLRGETALKLNEVEGLLVLAEQRLQLARDAEGARLALHLAASALDTLDDPLYAGLALPLRAELELLQTLPSDPLPGIRDRLSAALAAAPGLPRRPPQAALDASEESGMGRLQRALSGLVTVRHRSEAGQALSGSARDAAQEALQLDLRAALLAAEARDGAALAAALLRAQALIERLFDPLDPAVLSMSQGLDGLEVEALSPPLPALGTTLAELRALRGSRQRLTPQDVELQPAPPPESVESSPQADTAASSPPAAPTDLEKAPEPALLPELERPVDEGRRE